MTEVPRHGEIWDVDFGTPVGHEAAIPQLALVISNDRSNTYGLVVVCPITRTRKKYLTRVERVSLGTGLDETSYVQVEQVRTISTERLIGRRGRQPRRNFGPPPGFCGCSSNSERQR